MTDAETMTIMPGMVLAIERALSLKDVGTAAGEQNILVLDDGIEVLTAGVPDRWR